MFLVILEANINISYIITIIYIKRNFKSAVNKAAIIKIIIIKIITTAITATTIIKFILFIIRKSIIRY